MADRFALEMKGITKDFPGVRALDNVDFSVRQGTIHALVGENGAGKSTLIKILGGVYPFGSYQGDLIVNGQIAKYRGPKNAELDGIGVIHQELNLVSHLSVGENIFLSRLPSWMGLVDWKSVQKQATELLSSLGLEIDSRQKVSTLGIGQQQLVEIARAIGQKGKILVLDEPTAALAESEVHKLFGLLNRLRDQGVTCIYISHRLAEVFELADSITVLRDGRVVGTQPRAELDYNRVVSMMVGRNLKDLYPSDVVPPGDVVFSVQNYTVPHPSRSGRNVVDDVSFQVRKGEILGFSGLLGAGRSEMALALFGGYASRGFGRVELDGKELRAVSPSKAIHQGMALVTEDRKETGLVLSMSVSENTSLAILRRLLKWYVLSNSKEKSVVASLCSELRVKTSSLHTMVNTLSGGNQQKIVLAKWLATAPKVLILDEPTRGIDVGARAEIYQIIKELAKKGVAIILISSDLLEIMGMSDRILVMSKGRITGEFLRDSVSEDEIMACATGTQETTIA